MDPAPIGLLALNPWVPRRALTVGEYRRMGEAGILTEDDRVELIDGELVAMSPVGSPHAGTVNRLTRLLVRAVGDRAVVSVQNPVQLGDDSEPEPDIALLKPRPDDYTAATPRADDVLLLIEVADSSLNYDRRVKRVLYARHGIPELWIVNVEAGEIEVCREPTEDGYASVETAGRDDTITLVALPDVTILVRSVID